MSNAGQHSQCFIFYRGLSLSIGIFEYLAAEAGIVGIVANAPVGRLHGLGFDHIVDMGESVMDSCVC